MVVYLIRIGRAVLHNRLSSCLGRVEMQACNIAGVYPTKELKAEATRLVREHSRESHSQTKS
jgi:hypothetical protein